MARHRGWRSQGDAGAGGDLSLARLPSGVLTGERYSPRLIPLSVSRSATACGSFLHGVAAGAARMVQLDEAAGAHFQAFGARAGTLESDERCMLRHLE